MANFVKRVPDGWIVHGTELIRALDALPISAALDVCHQLLKLQESIFDESMN